MTKVKHSYYVFEVNYGHFLKICKQCICSAYVHVRVFKINENSGADTIRSASSLQHQMERQTNAIKQPKLNRGQAELTTLF